MAGEEKRHRIEVEEDHGFFGFFLDLFKKRKKKARRKPRGKSKGKYHGFMSKKVYEAFKAQWGKSHKRRKKKKVSIEFETAKELKEAAEVIKHMKGSSGTREVFQKTRYVESLDDKIERVKQMLKHLDFEYMKRHISPEEFNRRKFEYLEALRFLKSQKKMREKAAAGGKTAGPGKGVGKTEPMIVQPAGAAADEIKVESVVPKAPKIRPGAPGPRPTGPQAKPVGQGRGPARPKESLRQAEQKKAVSQETAKRIAAALEGLEKKVGERKAAVAEKPVPVQQQAPKPEPAAGTGPVPSQPELQKQTAESLAKIAKAMEKGVPETGSKAKIVVKDSKRRVTSGPSEAKPQEEPAVKKPGQFKPAKPEKPAGAKKSSVKVVAVETPIDKFVEIVKQHGKISFGGLANILNWAVESVERVGLVLEKQGIVDVHYPTMVTAKPSVSFVKELPPVARFSVKGELLEEYGFVVDFVPANAKVYKVKEEQRPVYQLVAPYVGAYTRAFFDELQESIAEQIPVEVSEINDTKKSKALKKKFFDVAKKELKRYLGESSKEQVEILAGLLLHSMYGLGEIEMLAGDNQLEEIAINSAKSPVTVYHKEYGWLQSTVFMPSEEDIFNYAAQIGRKVGREINTLHPILDAHLLSGDRVNATLNPISGFGNTITIRRFARRPWTIVDFIGRSHTMNLEMASILWMAMHYEMSVIVAGGTASGKTSCLNALSSLIPAYHRVISIEDVREIMLPKYMHWNWVPLTTRNPNPEGMGEVSMLSLMQATLRMRPDRIILGEIRRKREAEVLFEAMHTGHSVYSTLHANNAQQVIRRLTEPPIDLPPLEIEAVDLLLVQYRDRRKNIRRTYEITEVESGVSGDQISINTIFRWDPRSDTWDAVNPATNLIRELNLHTGMTEDEITSDLEGRASILQWMQENKLSEIDDVGRVMKKFYSQPEILRKGVESNESPESVLGGKK